MAHHLSDELQLIVGLFLKLLHLHVQSTEHIKY